MTEFSWPWDTEGAGVGDGAAQLNEALSREFLSLYFGIQNPAAEGVSKGVMNELAVSGIASPLSVATGSAICYGLYRNTAVVNLAVSTPAVGTTGGRICLQTNWAGTGGAPLEARTRLAVIMSADGNPAYPALTQAFSTTWEISLATFTITTGGVISLHDDRTFRRSTAMVDTDEITDLAVTTGKIEALAVTTAKLGALAVAESKIAALAVTEGKIGALAVTEGKIGALAVTSGKIGANAVIAGKLANGAVDTPARLANDIVDDTKAGDRMPQFYRRQGGSAAVWETEGTTTYTPTAVRMQGGSAHWTGVSANHGTLTVNFPVAFSNHPLVFATGRTSTLVVTDQTVGETLCTFYWELEDGSSKEDVFFFWLAIGPE